MTLEVLEDKISLASELICHWLSSPRATKSDLQSLVGKLSYICTCISPGKIFMQWMLYELLHLPHKSSSFTPRSALLADLRLWNEILAVYNGVSLLHSFHWIDATVRFCTNTCLSGIGGFLDGHFFHSSYPPFINTALLSIPSLEMLAVIFSFKTVVRGTAWPADFSLIWQSKHWTCHQHRSSMHPFCPIMFMRTLVLCFLFWFWASVEGTSVITGHKCNEVTSVIRFGHKCNKVTSVIRFGHKCNKGSDIGKKHERHQLVLFKVDVVSSFVILRIM